MKKKKKYSRILGKYYSYPMVLKLRTNKAKPSMNMAFILNKKEKIPLDAWENFKNWLCENEKG